MDFKDIMKTRAKFTAHGILPKEAWLNLKDATDLLRDNRFLPISQPVTSEIGTIAGIKVRISNAIPRGEMIILPPLPSQNLDSILEKINFNPSRRGD